jgi:hypothetical protein
MNTPHITANSHTPQTLKAFSNSPLSSVVADGVMRAFVSERETEHQIHLVVASIVSINRESYWVEPGNDVHRDNQKDASKCASGKEAPGDMKLREVHCSPICNVSFM